MNIEPKLASKRPFSIARWAMLGAVASAVMIVVACGSDNDDGARSADDGGAETGAQTPPPSTFEAGASDAKPPINCSPPEGFDDCTGKCGPVRNPCTGAIVKQCGGCQADGGDAGALVCDLESNSCITPKITCEDLGAECGRIRNSCGIYLDCPAGNADVECPAGSSDGGFAGQECDPDTHKCKTATSVVCADLGYECGNAWLGVGPKTTLTNCGDCTDHPGKPRCNSGLIAQYNICEPACDAPSTKDAKVALCRAAHVECGIISDGCGGALDCSDVDNEFVCKNGEGCGLRGIANRCDVVEPPPECVAAGRNCGTIKSVCDGKTYPCGTCTGTDICNDNGVCGPPCVPKKCADLGNPECLPSGTPVSDGCNGNIADCAVCPGGPAACKPNPNGDAGVAGGVCCVPTFDCTNRPPGVDGNVCGADHRFDNGCGVQIECGCPGGTCANGMCCSPKACPAPGAVTADCGNFDRGCGLSCNQTCANDAQGNNNTCSNGKCCNPEPDNAAEWRAANPGRCAFNISNLCGGLVDADCTGGAVCVDAAAGAGPQITKPGGGVASKVGFCCANPNANCTAGNSCTSVANACVTGAPAVNCGANLCPDGADGQNDEVCVGGACCDPATCPAARPEGSTCGGGSFDRGCGLTCNPGCANDTGGRANTCFNGTCCNPEPDDATEWRAGQPAGSCAFNISNGCGGQIDVGCNSGQVCQLGGTQINNTGSTPTPVGTCCTTATSCGGAVKQVGEACVVDNVCLGGSETITCSCAGSAQCFNGTCCGPQACPGAQPLGGSCATFQRGCGLSCVPQCAAGSCYQDKCCAPQACPGAAPIGGTCGGFNRGCGQTCTIGCDTSGQKTNNTCVNNTCVCIPKECPAGFSGSMQNGCGQIKACTGS